MPDPVKAPALSFYQRWFPETRRLELEKLIKENNLSEQVTQSCYVQNEIEAEPGFAWIYRLYDASTLGDWLALLPSFGSERYFFLSFRRQKQLTGDQENDKLSLADYNQVCYEAFCAARLNSDMSATEADYFPTPGQRIGRAFKWLAIVLLAATAIGLALTGLGLLVQLGLSGGVIAALGGVPVLSTVLSFLVTNALALFPALLGLTVVPLTVATVAAAVVGLFSWDASFNNNTFQAFELRYLSLISSIADNTEKDTRVYPWDWSKQWINEYPLKFALNPVRWLSALVVFTKFSVHRLIQLFPIKVIAKPVAIIWEISISVLGVPLRILRKLGDIPVDYIFPTLGKLLALALSPVVALGFLVARIVLGKSNAGLYDNRDKETQQQWEQRKKHCDSGQQAHAEDCLEFYYDQLNAANRDVPLSSANLHSLATLFELENPKEKTTEELLPAVYKHYGFVFHEALPLQKKINTLKTTQFHEAIALHFLAEQLDTEPKHLMQSLHSAIDDQKALVKKQLIQILNLMGFDCTSYNEKYEQDADDWPQVPLWVLYRDLVLRIVHETNYSRTGKFFDEVAPFSLKKIAAIYNNVVEIAKQDNAFIASENTKINSIENKFFRALKVDFNLSALGSDTRFELKPQSTPPAEPPPSTKTTGVSSKVNDEPLTKNKLLAFYVTELTGKEPATLDDTLLKDALFSTLNKAKKKTVEKSFTQFKTSAKEHLAGQMFNNYLGTDYRTEFPSEKEKLMQLQVNQLNQAIAFELLAKKSGKTRHALTVLWHSQSKDRFLIPKQLIQCLHELGFDYTAYDTSKTDGWPMVPFDTLCCDVVMSLQNGNLLSTLSTSTTLDPLDSEALQARFEACRALTQDEAKETVEITASKEPNLTTFTENFQQALNRVSRVKEVTVNLQFDMNNEEGIQAAPIATPDSFVLVRGVSCGKDSATPPALPPSAKPGKLVDGDKNQPDSDVQPE